MLISEFSDAVKYEYSKCATKEDVEVVQKAMLDIVNRYKVLKTVSLNVEWKEPTTKTKI